jgi:hypothetical protein
MANLSLLPESKNSISKFRTEVTNEMVFDLQIIVETFLRQKYRIVAREIAKNGTIMRIWHEIIFPERCTKRGSFKNKSTSFCTQ